MAEEAAAGLGQADILLRVGLDTGQLQAELARLRREVESTTTRADVRPRTEGTRQATQAVENLRSSADRAMQGVEAVYRRVETGGARLSGKILEQQRSFERFQNQISKLRFSLGTPQDVQTLQSISRELGTLGDASEKLFGLRRNTEGTLEALARPRRLNTREWQEYLLAAQRVREELERQSRLGQAGIAGQTGIQAAGQQVVRAQQEMQRAGQQMVRAEQEMTKALASRDAATQKAGQQYVRAQAEMQAAGQQVVRAENEMNKALAAREALTQRAGRQQAVAADEMQRAGQQIVRAEEEMNRALTRREALVQRAGRQQVVAAKEMQAAGQQVVRAEEEMRRALAAREAAVQRAGRQQVQAANEVQAAGQRIVRAENEMNAALAAREAAAQRAGRQQVQAATEMQAAGQRVVRAENEMNRALAAREAAAQRAGRQQVQAANEMQAAGQRQVRAEREMNREMEGRALALNKIERQLAQIDARLLRVRGGVGRLTPQAQSDLADLVAERDRLLAGGPVGGRAQMTELQHGVRGINAELKTLGATAKTTQSAFDEFFGRFGRYAQIAIGLTIVYGSLRAAMSGVEFLLEIDKAMTRIDASLERGANRTEIFRNSFALIVETMKTTGASVQDASGLIVDMTRALDGNQQMIQGALRPALALLSLGEVEQSEVVRTLIGVYNLFGKSLGETLPPQEKFNQLAGQLLVASQLSTGTVATLTEAVKNAGSQAAISGTSFADLLAILTLLQDSLKKSGLSGTEAARVFQDVQENARNISEAFGFLDQINFDRPVNAMEVLVRVVREVQKQGALTQRQFEVLNSVFQDQRGRRAILDLVGTIDQLGERSKKIAEEGPQAVAQTLTAISKGVTVSFKEMVATILEQVARVTALLTGDVPGKFENLAKVIQSISSDVKIFGDAAAFAINQINAALKALPDWYVAYLTSPARLNAFRTAITGAVGGAVIGGVFGGLPGAAIGGATGGVVGGAFGAGQDLGNLLTSGRQPVASMDVRQLNQMLANTSQRMALQMGETVKLGPAGLDSINRLRQLQDVIDETQDKVDRANAAETPYARLGAATKLAAEEQRKYNELVERFRAGSNLGARDQEGAIAKLTQAQGKYVAAAGEVARLNRDIARDAAQADRDKLGLLTAQLRDLDNYVEKVKGGKFSLGVKEGVREIQRGVAIFESTLSQLTGPERLQVLGQSLNEVKVIAQDFANTALPDLGEAYETMIQREDALGPAFDRTKSDLIDSKRELAASGDIFLLMSEGVFQLESSLYSLTGENKIFYESLKDIPAGLREASAEYDKAILYADGFAKALAQGALAVEMNRLAMEHLSTTLDKVTDPDTLARLRKAAEYNLNLGPARGELERMVTQVEALERQSRLLDTAIAGVGLGMEMQTVASTIMKKGMDDLTNSMDATEQQAARLIQRMVTAEAVVNLQRQNIQNEREVRAQVDAMNLFGEAALQAAAAQRTFGSSYDQLTPKQKQFIDQTARLTQLLKELPQIRSLRVVGLPTEQATLIARTNVALAEQIALYRDGVAALEEYNTAQERVSAVALDLYIQLARLTGNFVDFFILSMGKAAGVGRSFFSDLEQLASGTARNLETAFSDLFFARFTGDAEAAKAVWKNLMNSMLREIANFMGQQVVRQLLLLGLSAATGGDFSLGGVGGGGVGGVGGGGGGGMSTAQLAQYGLSALGAVKNVYEYGPAAYNYLAGAYNSLFGAATPAASTLSTSSFTLGTAATGIAPSVEAGIAAGTIAPELTLGTSAAVPFTDTAVALYPVVADATATGVETGILAASETGATLGVDTTLSAAGTGTSLLGVASGVLGALVAAYYAATSIHTLVTADEKTTTERQKNAAYGALAGLAAGAVIGTLIMPGIGTAIGAGLGAAIGHFAGGYIGAETTPWMREQQEIADAIQGMSNFIPALAEATSPIEVFDLVSDFMSQSELAARRGTTAMVTTADGRPLATPENPTGATLQEFIAAARAGTLRTSIQAGVDPNEPLGESDITLNRVNEEFAKAIKAKIEALDKLNLEIHRALDEILKETINPANIKTLRGALLADAENFRSVLDNLIDRNTVQIANGIKALTLLTDPIQVLEQIQTIKDLVTARYEDEIALVRRYSEEISKLSEVWAEIGQSVQDQVANLRLTQFGAPDPMAALTLAQGRFNEAFESFRESVFAGVPDPAAATRVQELVDPLLTAASNVFARPSAQFRGIFDDVVQALEYIEDQAQVVEQDMNDALLVVLGEMKTIDELVEKNTADMAKDMALLREISLKILESIGFDDPLEVEGAHWGGVIPGYGTRDTVPAMLTPGEFVMNQAATAAHLGQLTAWNAQVQGAAFNGISYVPRDGLYTLHRGETVTPWWGGANMNGAGGSTMTLNIAPGAIQITGVSDPEQAADMAVRKLEDSIRTGRLGHIMARRLN